MTGWIVSIELIWWSPVEHATTVPGPCECSVTQFEKVARVHGVKGQKDVKESEHRVLQSAASTR